MVKQVKFYDSINDVLLGGLLFEDGSILCGECGAIIEPSDIEDLGISIVKIYEHWYSFSDVIIDE